MAVIAFSWGVAVLPDSDNEVWIANKVTNTAQWFERQVDNISGLEKDDENDESSTRFVKAWLSEKPLKNSGWHTNAFKQKFSFCVSLLRKKVKIQNSSFVQRKKLAVARSPWRL
jgi:hypothetical protein